MSADKTGGGRHRQPVDLLGQLSTLALGAGGGLAINTASPDVGYRGAAGALLIGMAISTIRWFRRLPEGAPLVRYAPPVLLGLAMCCAVFTLLRPGSWATTSVILGVGLATVAVLLPTDRALTWRLLRGVSAAGLGVSSVGAGIATLHDGTTVIGTAFLAVGVVFVGAGIATLHGGLTVVVASCVGLGVVFVGVSIAGLAVGHTLLGVAGILFGVGAIVNGIGALRGDGALLLVANRRRVRNPLLGTAGTLQGIAFIGMGFATMRGDGTLLAVSGTAGSMPFEFALVGAGVALAGCGIATLYGGRAPLGIATVGFGAALLGFGIPVLRGGNTLFGVAGVGLGFAVIGIGVTTLGHGGVWRNVGRWAGTLTRDPASPIPARPTPED